MYEIVKPYKNTYIILAITVVLMAILTPARPYLIQYTVDNMVLTGDIQGLVRITMLMLLLLAIESVMRYYFSYYSNWLGQTAIKDIRQKVFTHITNLRLQFFDTNPIGTLTTRTVSDIETISQIFSDGLLTTIGDILQIIVILALMLYTDWRLTLVSLSVLPLLLLASYIFKEGIKKSFQAVRTYVSAQNTFLQEHITGMHIVQIFNKENTEYQKFSKINKDLKDANIKGVMYYSVFFPVVEIITAGSQGLLVWYGANRVLDFECSIGTIIAFVMYVNLFFRPVRVLADKVNTLQMGFVASDRVFKLLDTQETIADEGTEMLQDLKGEIVFKNVSFGYNAQEKVLKNISFTAKAGEITAIVGATGSGKSSIINILNRFYEFESGEITIDGKNIKTINQQNLRQNIGTIMQDVFLFSSSIYENITLKNPDISLEKIDKIARYTGINKFIEKLPGGYAYNVMERGYALSAGQRQLVAFLRAMIYDPKILILDEATSAIDTETEAILQEATEKLMLGRTGLVVAHRLSTIKNAHQILVLDQGEIIERGTHDELLAQGGAYHRLYLMQFEHEMA